MITVYTILVFLAILMQSFFTATEMAFTSTNKLKLKNMAEAGDPHAVKLLNFLGREGAFLGTTLVGTNIAVILNSVLATRIFIDHFGHGIAPVLTTLVMVPLTLVFGEILPKIIARQYATGLSLRLITPLSAFFSIFRPIIISVEAVSSFLLSPAGPRKKPWDVTFTKTDLKRLLLMGHETGEVNADEVEMIHKVLDFGAITVEKIMIPLYRATVIGMDESVENLKKLVSLTGFTRIPVYKDHREKIEGVVNIYDVLFSENGGEGTPLSDLMRDPVNVSHLDPIDIVLARLRFKKQPMGIVTSQDGTAVGVVTIEDILEEIVGEIEEN
ncbi:MAG: hemolysin family protein [Candidatus Omnitrophica bacterium]|jgi:CBS domain containing-hemolysin-like protein|nr:hemolysin family protein [Candidatus Omnitrophota bacterium]MDD4012704.1 hemolysin family protein [Candidatus Omnitrophota bacterium]